MIQNILKRTSLSQGADALVCCYSHRCVDSRLCEDSAAPAEQALVPVGVRGRRLRAGGHAPFLKKKNTPQHSRVCPFLNYIHQNTSSALIIDSSSKRSSAGSPTSRSCEIRESPKRVLCVTSSMSVGGAQHLSSVCPCPRRVSRPSLPSPRPARRIVSTPWGGAWRGQGVTW